MAIAIHHARGSLRKATALRSSGGSLTPLTRLLVLAGDLPYPPTNGYRIRVWHLLRTLKEMGCELHLLSLGRQDEFAAHKDQLLSVCRRVETVRGDVKSLSGHKDYLGRLFNLVSKLPYGAARFKSSHMARMARAVLDDGRMDAVLCEEPFLAVNLPSPLPIPLIMDSHNVEHILIARYLALESNIAKRAYAALETKRLRRFERLCWQQSELTLVCSEHDRSTIASISPCSSVRIVPNVVDVSSYPMLPDEEESTVLYTGGMDWYPNRDAVTFFASAILPKLRLLVPGVKLKVAGREASAKFRRRFTGIPDIKFIGSVPDMRAEIGKAAVCVVPLRIGSGTRLKILEAAAMAKPIVSTRIGAEGLEFTSPNEILLADGAEEFATAVAALLQNRSLRQSLGQAARRRVEKQYSVSALHEALQSAFSLTAEPPEGLSDGTGEGEHLDLGTSAPMDLSKAQGHMTAPSIKASEGKGWPRFFGQMFLRDK